MLVLDTNVLSELMAAAPERRVAAWVLAQPEASLFTTTVCQAEILAGLEVMPHGRRRAALEQAARAMFREDFAGRVLTFDAALAEAYAGLFAARRRLGRPASTADLMIAAIAVAHEAGVATRNIADFEGCGVEIVDPWNV